MSGLFKRNNGNPPPSVPKPPTEPDTKVPSAITLEKISDLLIQKAQSQVDVRESAPNDGVEVRKYQAIIGKAEKEAWCMSFMQWVSLQVCTSLGITNPLHPSEHCATVWDNTQAKYRLAKPKRGAVFIQKSRTSDDGHTGLCLDGNTPMFKTIEGNTNAAGSRDGDGVYENERYTTGTPTRTVLGYIDLPRMIYDVLYSGNTNNGTAPNPVATPPNKRGNWEEHLDRVIMDMVTPELLSLPISRMKKFIPQWEMMNQMERRQFFADLLFAMAKYESNHVATSMFLESDLGRDAVTGLPVVSEGLLQMSYQDAKWYPIPWFDYKTDATEFKKDWENRGGRKSWTSSYPRRSTLIPENGVRAAMVVFIKLLTNPKYANTEFADTIGKYWSVMRRERTAFSGVCKILKEKGYKI